MPKVILILRGAPGSGKSTIAKALVASGLFDSYHEADDFYISDGVYKYDRNLLADAHRWCQNKVRNAMSQGDNVIVSNTNLREAFVRVYKEFAAEFGYTVMEIAFLTAPFESIHNVPEEAQKNMQLSLCNSLMYFASHKREELLNDTNTSY